MRHSSPFGYMVPSSAAGTELLCTYIHIDRYFRRDICAAMDFIRNLRDKWKTDLERVGLVSLGGVAQSTPA